MAIVFMISAILFASIEPIIIKFGYNSTNLDPLYIIVFKNIIGGVVIIPLTTLLGNRFKILNVRDIFNIAYASVLLFFTTSMIILSLKFIPASIMLTIFTTTPAFVSIINNIRGREKNAFGFWIGFSLSFIGIFLLLDVFYRVKNFDLNFFIGVFLAFLGVFSSSFYRIRLEELTKEYTAIVVSTYIFLVNCLLAFIFGIILGVIFDFRFPEVYIGIYGGIAGALANISFVYALSILGSTKVSVLNMLQQPTIIVLSSILLKENLKYYQFLGIVLVLFGVNLAVRKINRIVKN